MYGLAKASPSTVDGDADSEADEEVQTLPATEVKSFSVSAQPSDDSEDSGDTPNYERMTVQSLFRNLTSLSSRQQHQHFVAGPAYLGLRARSGSLPTDSATLVSSALKLPRTNASTLLMCLNPPKRQHRLAMLTYVCLPYEKRNLQLNVTRPGIS